MVKAIIVINGKGGVGKDTLIDFVREYCKIQNVSAITPIKSVARLLGWHGEKTLEARKFLSDLKALSIAYNDYPTEYLLRQANKFLNNKCEYVFMFVHIREAEEIQKFKDRCKGNVFTLLVRRDIDVNEFGNSSDDDVENYNYDYVFDNNKSLEEAKNDFMALMDTIISRCINKV